MHEQGIGSFKQRLPTFCLSPLRPSPVRLIKQLWLVILCLAVCFAKEFSNKSLAAEQKRRVFVLTDIENEPDDAQSLVRFLTYANQFDIEGLVATTSVHQQQSTAAWRIKEIVAAYGQVQPNLLKHEPGFPTGEQLLAVIRAGRPEYGMNAVGADQDSTASELLIAAVDRDDPRPLWVTVWGGPNVLAQALWKVQNTRTPVALNQFVDKLRVYTISDQDDSGPWLRKTFPTLFYIASPGLHAGGAYHFATWSGISGDKFHGRFPGADFSLVDNPWLDRNIRQDSGPLGAQYPRTEYLMEGDTPSFLGLVDNGLNRPDNPHWGGWGGRYELYTPRLQKWFLEPETRPLWTDAVDEIRGVDGQWHTSNHATIWRWRAAYQNDFAARIDWTTKAYRDANHPPVVRLTHPAQLQAKLGEQVSLSAQAEDPDGNELNYEWFYYGEPGTFTTSKAQTGQPLSIESHDQPQASFSIPTDRVMPPGIGTMHVVLAVTDRGTPPLTRYQRVIVEVRP